MDFMTSSVNVMVTSIARGILEETRESAPARHLFARAQGV